MFAGSLIEALFASGLRTQALEAAENEEHQQREQLAISPGI